jgi:DNA-binding NarL/FixJ family response regulator
MSALARVLLAEPDMPTRMGIRLALTGSGFEIAAEAGDARAAVESACSERPDLAVLAADLPGDGIDAVRRITSHVPGTKTVVLTARQGGEELVAAVLAGASGYLGKDISPSRLPRALRGVLAGEVALPRLYTAYVLEALRGRDARRAHVLGRTRHFVTDRQWEILNMLADGRSTAQMAGRLGISEITARRHISAVLGKLGLADRASAIKLMQERSPE